jgi:HK97 family phage prohead protease
MKLKPIRLAPKAGRLAIEMKGAPGAATSEQTLDTALDSIRRRYGAKAELKTFTLTEVKALDDETGTFEGYLSVWDVVDHGSDSVKKGAFTKTLAEKAKAGRFFPILWYHNPYEPLGVFTEMREDAKGLYVKGKLNLEVQAAREKYALLKQGAIDSMSIGYTALKWETKNGIRYLQELKLWEGSLVTFAMNEDALVTSVKASGAGSGHAGKAADFATTLDLNQRRSELWNRHWAIESALSQSNRGVIDSQDLDRQAKLEAIDDNLGQYHDAMLAWWSDWLTLKEDEASANSAEEKGAPFPFETKAGRKISADTRKRLEAAKELLDELLSDGDVGEGDGKKDAGGGAGPTVTTQTGGWSASLVEQMKAGDALAQMKAAK